jgi:hypothetical protein
VPSVMALLSLSLRASLFRMKAPRKASLVNCVQIGMFKLPVTVSLLSSRNREFRVNPVRVDSSLGMPVVPEMALLTAWGTAGMVPLMLLLPDASKY